MPRPLPVTDPIVRLNLCLPRSLRRRLDHHLWSPTERCVPKGAYQALFTQLLERYFERVGEP